MCVRVRDTTPLHFAAAQGDDDMVELLVQPGANVAVVDRFGLKAVDYAVVGGWPKTVELIGGIGGGIGCSGLAELRQRTVVFRWETLVGKEVVSARSKTEGFYS